MDTIKLNTGAEMPVLGFGTWQMWLNGQANKAVTAALQDGYRLIDTARLYRNEKGVGRAIRDSGIPRSEIFVTTKLWNADQGYDSALKAFDASLKRLDMDYVDLYLIHWPSSDKRRDSWRALQEIHKSGRAKAIGVSNYTVHHMEELLAESAVVPAVNQVEFHPFIYAEQQPILELCRANGIVLEAYSPLAQGRLGDPRLKAITANYNKSPAQVMLRWAIQHGTVPIPKSTNPDRIRQNHEIFDFSLTDDDMEKLNEMSDGMHASWNPTNVV